MVRVNDSALYSINGPSSSQNAPCPRRKVGEDSLAMALRWPLARFSTGAEPLPPPTALFLGGIPPPSTVTRGDFRPLEPSAHRQGIQKDRRLRRTHSAWPDEHVHGHRTLWISKILSTVLRSGSSGDTGTL